MYMALSKFGGGVLLWPFVSLAGSAGAVARAVPQMDHAPLGASAGEGTFRAIRLRWLC